MSISFRRDPVVDRQTHDLFASAVLNWMDSEKFSDDDVVDTKTNLRLMCDIPVDVVLKGFPFKDGLYFFTEDHLQHYIIHVKDKLVREVCMVHGEFVLQVTPTVDYLTLMMCLTS